MEHTYSLFALSQKLNVYKSICKAMTKMKFVTEYYQYAIFGPFNYFIIVTSTSVDFIFIVLLIDAGCEEAQKDPTHDLAMASYIMDRWETISNFSRQ